MNFGSLIDEKDQSEKFYGSSESVVQFFPRSASLKVKVCSTTKFNRMNNVSGEFKRALIK